MGKKHGVRTYHLLHDIRSRCGSICDVPCGMPTLQLSSPFLKNHVEQVFADWIPALGAE